jgi:hypothetical protein
MKASQRELCILKGLLESFSQSIGLRVNYKKTSLVPLNLPLETTQLLAGVFGCNLESLPFTYLGLSLSTTKPQVEHYGPIMTKVERRLMATSTFLTHPMSTGDHQDVRRNNTTHWHYEMRKAPLFSTILSDSE